MANSLIGNSAVATHMYQALYGQAPSNGLYNSYIDSLAATSPAAFAATMAGNFANVTDSALALQVLNNLGVTATTVTATGEYTKLLTALGEAFAAFPTMRGQVILNATNLFANLEADATYGAAAITYNKQALANFTYASNTANTSPGTAALPDPTIGTTYTLTTGVDLGAAFVGGAGNDTFNATGATLTGLDAIDGGAGSNTLSILDATGDLVNFALPTSMKNFSTLIVQSVKGLAAATTVANDISGITGLTSATFSLNDLESAASNVIKAAATTAVTLAAKDLDGGDTITVNGGSTVTVSETVTGTAGTILVSGTASSVSITEVASVAGGATNATDTGAGTTKTGTLGTVRLDGLGASSTVTSNALGSLTLANENGAGPFNVTITNTNTAAIAAKASALALTVDSLANGDITLVDTNAEIKTLNVTTSGDDSTLAAITDASLKTLTVGGEAVLTLTAAPASLTAATVTGAAGLVANLSAAAMTAVSTADTTGDSVLTIDATLATFAGGAGVDAVTTSAVAPSKAISLGSGDDSLTLFGGTTSTTGAISGGEGIDTLVMVAADAATADNSATFAGKVTGFEKLSLTGGGANTVDVAVLGNYTDISSVGDTLLTLGGVTSGSTLRLTGAGTAQTVSSTTALLSGLTDTLKVVVSGVTTAADVNQSATGLTATDIETVNVTSNYASAMTTANKTAAVAGGYANQITILGNQATTINVDGASGLDLTAADTALTAVNAGALTGEFSFTAGVLAASSVITGSATAKNTVTFSAAATASTFVTYVGGSGNDVVTGANGLKNVVNLGNGTNSYSGSSAAETITGGTGVDTINAGGGNDVIVGGGGADVITGGAGSDTITLSGITSKLVAGADGSSGANSSTTIQTAELTSTFDIVYGAAAGDKIDLVSVTSAPTTLVKAAVNLAGASATAAFAAGTYDAGAGTFTYAANGLDSAFTYSAAAATTYETIILVGYHAGSTTALAAGVVTLG